MDRILCIDYGFARMGLAITDPTNSIALPLTTLPSSKDPKKAAQLLVQYLQEKKFSITQFVLGLPLHLNGTESEMSKVVRSFAEELKALSRTPLTFIDERLSSSLSEKALKDAQYNRKERAKKSDETAAFFLLQEYLRKF